MRKLCDVEKDVKVGINLHEYECVSVFVCAIASECNVYLKCTRVPHHQPTNTNKTLALVYVYI